MKSMIKKLQKRNNKKGFTLVEIIVVLVIMAILAAIAVPAVMGYIDDAKEAKYVQEARSIYIVVQTEEARYTASGTTINYDDIATEAADKTKLLNVSVSKDDDGKYTIKFSENPDKDGTEDTNPDYTTKPFAPNSQIEMD